MKLNDKKFGKIFAEPNRIYGRFLVGDRLTMETVCSCEVAYTYFLSANKWRKKILCKLFSYFHRIKLFTVAL